MSNISHNTIKTRAFHQSDTLDQYEDMLERIREEVYPDRWKTWTRILNNSSQPTLSEAALIAHIMGVTIDDLFEFEKAPSI